MKLKKLTTEYLEKPRPVLKYAGGKQQMIEVLLSKVPKAFNRYIEPFFGGGALFFALSPRSAVISDSNPELINLYKVIAKDVEDLIPALKAIPVDEDTFYKIRKIDPTTLSEVERAARTVYLNRTCFNGLYRVNRRGQFNVPYGRYKNPNVCDEKNLRLASVALQGVEIVHGDYKDVLKHYAQPGDFIYLDPPYLPVSKYSDFKRYTKEQFYEEDHIELGQEVLRLHELGCYVLLTNSNHPLVHDIYSEYEIEVHQTRRLINSVASKRTGHDVLISIPQKKSLFSVSPVVQLPERVNNYPSTKYMGSKQNILEHIWKVASHFKFDSVLDLFSGSGVVAYMFKAQGKQVICNDYMEFCAAYGKALIENNTSSLSEADIEALCNPCMENDHFVSKTFGGLYYTDEDNAFIDIARANIRRIGNSTKQSLAISALVRACMKKRARGIFTYMGQRYDDGRRDLKLSLRDHFINAIKLINNAVFDNGKLNKAYCGDAMEVHQKADLVYIDPPYYSPLSDNEYVRRYHFVEGLTRDWQGVEMQWHTKTKKFKSYPTPFSSRKGAHEAFDSLFKYHRDSVLLVSYSSNSQPTKDEMLELIAKHKQHAEVVPIPHRYSFANQGHKRDIKNKVEEYLFIGY